MSKNLIVISRWAYSKAVMDGQAMSLIEYRQMEHKAFFLQRLKLGTAIRSLRLVLKSSVKRDLSRLVKAR